MGGYLAMYGGLGTLINCVFFGSKVVVPFVQLLFQGSTQKTHDILCCHQTATPESLIRICVVFKNH